MCVGERVRLCKGETVVINLLDKKEEDEMLITKISFLHAHLSCRRRRLNVLSTHEPCARKQEDAL